MNRREVLKSGSLVTGAIAGALALGAPNVIAKKKRFRWRLVMSVPKTLPIWGTGVQSFAEKIEKISDGDLQIRVFGAGELVPALDVFDAVKAGRVQMGHSASYYWLGKIPSAVFFTAVPFGLSSMGMKAWLAHGGGIDLWREVYEPHGIIPFPAGNTGMQMGGWFKKEITSIKDFKGLKMRIPGLGSRVFEKAGGKPMLVPGGEIYTNLSTGVIDATEWVGPYHDYIMGFHKVASHYYYPGWQEPGPVLELLVNSKAWQELPQDLQTVVQSCAVELDQQMMTEWLVKDSEYLLKIKNETKTKILPFPDDVLRSLKKFSLEAEGEIAQTSPLARKVLDSFEKFKNQFGELQRVSDIPYLMAQKNDR